MILRQQNWLGQMRVDIPSLRALESSVAGDFDVLAGKMLAGKEAIVINSFNIIVSGAIGKAASALTVNVQDGLLLHYLASESGTIFASSPTDTTQTLSSTNSAVSGDFISGQVNYVGLDLLRSPDTTTDDTVAFINPSTNKESNKIVPLARTLSYKFVISTSDFSQAANILPLAKVTVDTSGNVTNVEDARNLFFRLGSGGSFPNTANSYSWPQGRTEVTDTTKDTFSGGDKAISSLKAWMDAVMTSIWEVKGGTNWYSPTADRNTKLIRDPAKTYPEYNNKRSNFSWDGTNLLWQGLTLAFDSTGGTSPGTYYNTIADQISTSAGLTDLVDGQCVYVDLDRTSNAALTPKKAYLNTLNISNSSTVPGSRYIIAWRYNSIIYTRDATEDTISGPPDAIKALANNTDQIPITGSYIRLKTSGVANISLSNAAIFTGSVADGQTITIAHVGTAADTSDKTITFTDGVGGVKLSTTKVVLTPLATAASTNSNEYVLMAAAGSNGAGPVTLTGAKVGDTILAVQNFTTGAMQDTADFETTITVAD
ncbi:MAG: hypothetical protein KGI08_09795, partial [Thaumarchaeota archaeon]|nr:hypothetical protein [Nitrososphaerota archaeon]